MTALLDQVLTIMKPYTDFEAAMRTGRIVWLPRDWPYPYAIALSVHRVWFHSRAWRNSVDIETRKYPWSL